MKIRHSFTKVALGVSLLTASALSFATTNTDKPNILAIFGDDIGYWNVSFNNRGMMGYETPNIDRIAKEGLNFSDYYGEQSCTAGRAAFITGQIPLRVGLTKVGMAGSKIGLQKEDPTIADLLKEQGYMTAQFGKNHLGDRNEHLPTAHGFDEFEGNLYHLNLQEEPELADFPKGEEARFLTPRGVIKSSADGKVEDLGPLTKKRMETVDDEIIGNSLKFIDKAHAQNKPFFMWVNTTRMHVWTHLKEESRDKTGIGIYADGMVEHDAHVGQLLDKLDDLEIADNTIVLYSTDNGAEKFTWPDGGASPFHGEKATTWEGGFRVPAAVRWPGKFPAGEMVNGIVSHKDWLPTFLAAAGEPNIKEKLTTGKYRANGKGFNVHLDGYNMLDYLKSGGESEAPRNDFYYFTDTGDLSAVRFGKFKVMFSAQEAQGFDVWKNPMTPLAWPHLIDLRADPFESAVHDSPLWSKWSADRMFTMTQAGMKAKKLMETFVAYPPRQKPGSFSVDFVGQLEQLQAQQAKKGKK